MNAEQWQRVKQLLEQAIALDTTERSSFLDQSCGGDSDLRLEVESLLSSHEQAEADFLNIPGVNLKLLAPPAAVRRTQARAG